MSGLTFLTKDQILGKNKLDIFKKEKLECITTDFSILLGGMSYIGLFKKYGYFWTKTPHYNDVVIITRDGEASWNYVNKRNIGARPAIKYSEIYNYVTKKEKKNEILTIECGEYPQTAVSEEKNEELEAAYKKGNLSETGKCYTTDLTKLDDEEKSFQGRKYIEYEYNGEKYIRYETNSNTKKNELSQHRFIQPNSSYWIKVEPIEWMVDEKADIAITKKIIFAGIQFNKERNFEGNLEKTDIKKFMDTYFFKEILPKELIRYEKHKDNKEKRKGIKVKTVNVEKVEEISTKIGVDLKNESKKIDDLKKKADGMQQFTFLTNEQILGSKKLEIFKKYDTGCETSDYCLALDGYVNYTWWTQSTNFSSGEHYIICMGSNNEMHHYSQACSGTSARPAIAYSEIEDKSKIITNYGDGTLKVEYGEYPQTAVHLDIQKKLNKLLEEKKIKETGKKYTHLFLKETESGNYHNNYQQKYKEIVRKFTEYEYQGKKYINMTINISNQYQSNVRIKGKNYNRGDNIWIEVEPVYWLVDVKNDVALSEKSLFSAMPFKRGSFFRNGYDGNFENTNIKKYMNKYFVKEIEISKFIEKKEVEGKRSGIKSINIEKLEEMINEDTKRRVKVKSK